MDLISKLPPGITETILCLLPIQEAARTSVLSKEWRYQWLKIPKISFIEDEFEASTELSVLEQAFDRPSSRKVMTKRCKLLYAIYQVLLLHQGPIHEFILSMRAYGSCVEIDLVILHLLKENTVKILKLDMCGMYALPLSLFSLHQLTDLYLDGCSLYFQPSFSGFPSLTTLHFEYVETNGKVLLHLLSRCPLLKRLTLHSVFETGTYEVSIVDIFESLPRIEYLSVSYAISLCFSSDKFRKELPTALVHLKCFHMIDVCFIKQHGLLLFFLLIRSSPNLEKLELEIVDDTWLEDYDMGSFTFKDHIDIWLKSLKELEIIRFSNSENELDFLKLILAKSPVLKKLRILLSDRFAKDKELQISEILFGLPCASPLVKIIVCRLNSS